MNGLKINGYRRLSKTHARKLYEGGGTVYLVPCYMRPGGMWRPEVAISKGDRSEDAYYFAASECDFDRVVDEFMYYACKSGSGRYPAYYVREDA